MAVRSVYVLGYMMLVQMVLTAALQEKGKDKLDVKMVPVFDLTARLLNSLVLQVSVFFTTHVAAVLAANGEAITHSAAPHPLLACSRHQHRPLLSLLTSCVPPQ